MRSLCATWNINLLVRTPVAYTEESILTWPDYPKEVENAPCHVQLIGRRQKDEVLIQHAKIVEAILGNN